MSRPRPRLARTMLAVALAVVPVACSGDGDGDDDASETTAEPSATTAAPPATPDALPVSDAGAGAISVGATTVSFTVSRCLPEGDPAEPEAARTLFLLEGEGTTSSGAAFTVSVKRFRTGVENATFTDTITYQDTGRILQAQRIEVNGVVTDLRDPEAGTSLLRLRPDGVAAQAIAGPPGGAAGGEGLVGVALDATC